MNLIVLLVLNLFIYMEIVFLWYKIIYLCDKMVGKCLNGFFIENK